MKTVAKISGGVGSWAAARRWRDQNPDAELHLLFTDTLFEDEDAYRFLIAGAADLQGVVQPKFIKPFVEDFPDWTDREAFKKYVLDLRTYFTSMIPNFYWLVDGRDPWEVYFKERYIGNSRFDPCSKILKRKIADRWLKEHAGQGSSIIMGIDYEEEHRAARARPLFEAKGFRLVTPLCDQPYLSWKDRLSMVERHGLWLPRLNRMGFAHNNCGGFCCKAGQGHFKLFLEKFPERYDYCAEQESRFSETTGKNASILRYRKKTGSIYVTMNDFKKTVQGGGEVDPDMGGCSCFLADDLDTMVTRSGPQ